MFIEDFAKKAHYLVKLTRKGVPFERGRPLQEASQEELKTTVLENPALRAIDYASDARVILSGDTSFVAVGYILSQCDCQNPRIRYHNRLGYITLNEREARVLQPKL